MLRGVPGDPCKTWREPSIPGLGNIILLGQTKNTVHASLPDHESHKVVCVCYWLGSIIPTPSPKPGLMFFSQLSLLTLALCGG